VVIATTRRCCRTSSSAIAQRAGLGLGRMAATRQRSRATSSSRFPPPMPRRLPGKINDALVRRQRHLDGLFEAPCRRRGKPSSTRWGRRADIARRKGRYAKAIDQMTMVFRLTQCVQPLHRNPMTRSKLLSPLLAFVGRSPQTRVARQTSSCTAALVCPWSTSIAVKLLADHAIPIETGTTSCVSSLGNDALREINAGRGDRLVAHYPVLPGLMTMRHRILSDRSVSPAAPGCAVEKLTPRAMLHRREDMRGHRLRSRLHHQCAMSETYRRLSTLLADATPIPLGLIPGRALYVASRLTSR
jgi:hypothetical protein